MQNKKQAFTLVELIVVITILAILGTIAFISLQGYSKSARDSSRISDLNSIETTLELFALQTGYYPEPTGAIPITFSGAVVWSQGTLGDSLVGSLQRLNKKPIDPLTGSEYTYSRLNSKKEFELAAVLEEGNLASVAQVQAGDTIGYAHINGNYNGLVAKVSTGSQTYILAVPTLINANLGETSYEGVLINNTLVIEGGENLPSSYGNTIYKMNIGYDEGIANPIVYNSGNTLPANDADVNIFISALQATYSGSNISNGNITALVNTLDNADLLVLGNSLVVQSFGGKVANSQGGGAGEGGDWRMVDPNCDKPDRVIGNGQVWAGCNSTIGTTVAYYGNGAGQCGNYYGGGGSGCDVPETTNEMTFFNSVQPSPGTDLGVDNIFGALYNWDNVTTACTSGYRAATLDDWDTLTTYLIANNGGNTNIWWAGHGVKDETNNIINALQLPLAGDTQPGGTMLSYRGNFGFYWTATQYQSDPSLANLKIFWYNEGAISTSYYDKGYGGSVRCIKD